MRWTGKLAAIGILALLGVPTVLSVETQEAVSGHTSYREMGGVDACLAGIAGRVSSQVLWFGGQVLFERNPSGEQQYVWAVENGAPDPRDLPMVRTGEVYEFPDVNDPETTWTVTEYEYHLVPVPEDVEVHGIPPGVPPTSTPYATWDYDPNMTYHAWVVHLGPMLTDDAATGRPYNFVTIVDTCKLRERERINHTQSAGNWTSSDGDDTTSEDHPPGLGTHGHNGVLVDLYIGHAPWEASSREDPDGTPPPDGFAGEVVS